VEQSNIFIYDEKNIITTISKIEAEGLFILVFAIIEAIDKFLFKKIGITYR
jgi:hypothetical protein